MHDIRSSVVIESLPEAVFDHLNDWERLASYVPRLTLTPDDPDLSPELGAGYEASFAPMNPGVILFRTTSEVSDHYYPERLTLGLGPHAWVSWTLGRSGDLTLVQARVTFQMPLGFPGRILGNAASAVLQRDLDAQTRRLKGDVERT